VEEVVDIEEVVDVKEVVVTGTLIAVLVLTELEVAGLPIPWAIRSVTEKEAIMGIAKPPPITIFLRMARREGSTDANT
jgi:hypothetical protein